VALILIVSSSNSKVRIVTAAAPQYYLHRDGDYWQFLTAGVVLAFMMFVFGRMTRY
jgi:hypothetical protein